MSELSVSLTNKSGLEVRPAPAGDLCPPECPLHRPPVPRSLRPGPADPGVPGGPLTGGQHGDCSSGSSLLQPDIEERYFQSSKVSGMPHR